MVFRIALTEQAELDLVSVTAFLARQNQEAAVRIGDELVDAAFSLAHLPNHGAPFTNALASANSSIATT